MQNLLKILLRYSNFLVFIALEVAAFMLITFNNAYPRSSVFSTANKVVAFGCQHGYDALCFGKSSSDDYHGIK